MLLVDLLTGKAKLWQAWWLSYIIPSAILAAILNQIITRNLIVSPIVTWVVIFLSGFVTTLAPYAIFKCLDNCVSKGWTWVVGVALVLMPWLKVSGA